MISRGGASGDNNISGGAIVIITDGRFENKGIIDYGADGIVIIECTEFANDGVMTPTPHVVINPEE